MTGVERVEMAGFKEDRLYTVRDLAEKMGVTEHTVRRWVKEGKITTIRVGKKLMFTKEDIKKLLEN